MMVRFDHVLLRMPEGQEVDARAFYSGALGLTEIPKPKELAARGVFGSALVHSNCIWEQKGILQGKRRPTRLFWLKTMNNSPKSLPSTGLK